MTGATSWVYSTCQPAPEKDTKLNEVSSKFMNFAWKFEASDRPSKVLNEVVVVGVVVVVVADGIELCDSGVVLVDASPPSPQSLASSNSAKGSSSTNYNSEYLALMRMLFHNYPGVCPSCC